jgi:hypothetical protein
MVLTTISILYNISLFKQIEKISVLDFFLSGTSQAACFIITAVEDRVNYISSHISHVGDSPLTSKACCGRSGGLTGQNIGKVRDRLKDR